MARVSRPRRQLARAAKAAAASLLATAAVVQAQNTSTSGGSRGGNTPLASVNGTAKGNSWAVVGAPQVSAQQLFRGQGNKVGHCRARESRFGDSSDGCLLQVYILDKVENNPLQINGHPGESCLRPQAREFSSKRRTPCSETGWAARPVQPGSSIEQACMQASMLPCLCQHPSTWPTADWRPLLARLSHNSLGCRV